MEMGDMHNATTQENTNSTLLELILNVARGRRFYDNCQIFDDLIVKLNVRIQASGTFCSKIESRQR